MTWDYDERDPLDVGDELADAIKDARAEGWKPRRRRRPQPRLTRRLDELDRMLSADDHDHEDDY